MGAAAKSRIAEARETYRELRRLTCTGDLFAGLPTPAQFDADCRARLAGTAEPTPEQWVEAARASNREFVSRSNFNDAYRRGTPAARRPRRAGGGR